MNEKNSLLDKEILNRNTDNELSCVAAFEIAGKLHIPAKDIGEAADKLNIRLGKCQLGLFGYKPDKKNCKSRGTCFRGTQSRNKQISRRRGAFLYQSMGDCLKTEDPAIFSKLRL